MLVKKKNPEWFPSENKELKVGETIDITDPKQLILNGDAVALSESGAELSAFDLYGVMIKDELDEFKQFQAIKKAEAEKAALEAQKAELEAELAKAKTETPAPVAEPVAEPVAAPAPEPVAVEPVKAEPAKVEKKK